MHHSRKNQSHFLKYCQAKIQSKEVENFTYTFNSPIFENHLKKDGEIFISFKIDLKSDKN
ncbi:hypothetical protein B1J93_07365 [Leptospira kirschneri serovar Pomona]|uniref:Uncharacterized protein n=1 Tax=Leptospira kirschneri serovar Pomona TaxID=561005 RepID=A0A1T1DRT8_9LEPT|nr:hypothetical protein LEP1GSC166_3063 [Leptospira kirschneri]OOV43581.1 hypothetical protein B1J93_07365 [Leptospira kirschneri serovar Pomona]